MPYHVPFNQRDKNPKSQPPVYIGFEATPHHRQYANQRHYQYPPAYQRVQRPPFNWSAFTGLILALLSPFSMFLLAPIALLFSLRGLRRAPRTMAFVATIFSLGGTAILATAIFAIAQDNHHHRTAHVRAHQQRVFADQKASTSVSLDAAAIQFEKYRELNNGMLPNGIDGNLMSIKFSDAWKQELRYEPGEKQATIRSAGPDKQFETRDDMVTTVKGTPQHSIISTTE